MTSIKDHAFVNVDGSIGCTNLTDVYIPDSVTSIGGYAFAWCGSLTNINMPNTITNIGDMVFFAGGSSLLTGTLNLPASLISIGIAPFDQCGFANINVDSGNPNYSSIGGVLFNKNQTILIEYPGGKGGSYTIPNSVASIADNAFNWNGNVSSVTIPNSVTNIGHNSFEGCCGLITIIIPSSVLSVGNNAFANCTVPDKSSGLTTVTLNSSTPPLLGKKVFDSDSLLTAIKVPAGSVTAYKAASGWADYASIIVSQ